MYISLVTTFDVCEMSAIVITGIKGQRGFQVLSYIILSYITCSKSTTETIRKKCEICSNTRITSISGH